jgi:hypothetical protein
MNILRQVHKVPPLYIDNKRIILASVATSLGGDAGSAPPAASSWPQAHIFLRTLCLRTGIFLSLLTVSRFCDSRRPVHRQLGGSH